MARGKPRSGADRAPVRGPRGGRERGPRGRAEAHWLYGRHAVRAALANPARRCRRLVLTAEAARTLGGLAAAGPGGAPSPEIVGREELAALLPEGAVHQGVALLAAPLMAPGLEAACAPGTEGRNLVVVLDRVSDPRNAGAVLRAAAAFGARAVVVPRRHGAGASGALAKAASGALEVVPLVAVANLARALATLKRLGYWCVGLDEGAAASLAEADPAGDVALVLGAEGRGLRRLTRARCDALARLPTRGPVGSLNVSAAAAVALYELVRRP